MEENSVLRNTSKKQFEKNELSTGAISSLLFEDK